MGDSLSAEGGNPVWASYSFRSAGPATWKVTLSFSNASSNSQVAVYVDGVLVGTQGTAGESVSYNANVASAGLHGVVVRAAAGSFLIKSVAVE